MTEENLIVQPIATSALSLHEDAHRIPVMSDVEWADFIESVRTKKRITDPIFALPCGRVFDGRHRLRAAIELGIGIVPVIFYDINEDEALERMADSAVLRRSLLPGQRAAITLEFTELVERLRAEARERQRKAADETNARLGRGDMDETQVSVLAQPTTTGKTRDILANKAGIGKSSMTYLMAVQRDAPELFAEVKDGKRTINSAYTEVKERNKIPTDIKKKTDTESKLVKLQSRRKISAQSLREAESPVSPNNILIKYTNDKLTPFIDGFILNYGALKNADDGAREPFLTEVKVLFEASFRILAEFQEDKLLNTLEEISDEKE